MMSDKEFLTWISDRLVHVYKENPNYDYMLRFQRIIQRIEELEEIEWRYKELEK
jgi:hypothetical protein